MTSLFGYTQDNVSYIDKTSKKKELIKVTLPTIGKTKKYKASFRVAHLISYVAKI